MKRLYCVIALCLAALLVFPSGHTAAAEEPEVLIEAEDLVQSPELDDAREVALSGSGITTISESGTYLLSGTYQGQLLIDAGKSDRITLVLNGVSIQNDSSAAIYIKKAEKVSVLLSDGTENTLTNGGKYENSDDDNVDAVLFSKADLVLKGSGSLSIQADAGHGIVSKDSLIVTGGNYTISAQNCGISGKDAVCITDGTFRITSGGGSENGTMKPSDAMGFSRMWGGNTASQDAEESIGKGIKSSGNLEISGGTFTLDCADDALHAGGNLTIGGGSWDIRTADDALHADADVTIDGGSFRIPYCYEGIEGRNITISGGDFQITATDDGINAADGTESASPWGNPFGGSNASIVINGGNFTIVSDGDCLDSNGSLTLNGGTLNLTCNGNGNSAIDYETEYSNNGADVTTNDGSENGNGFPHGGFGGRGQKPDGDFGQRPDDGSQQDGWGHRPDSGNPPEGSFPGRGQKR